MKSSKVHLFCSLAFSIFSLCKEKIKEIMERDLEGYPKNINLNTSKNSTFTFEPNVWLIVFNMGKQVFSPVKLEVYFDDSSSLIEAWQPSQNCHLKLNLYLETNT